MFHAFLIKYGEIGIKGKNRYMFEDALVRQIRHSLKDLDGLFHTYKAQGRVYVDCDGDYDGDEVVEALKRVFGIVGICPVVRVEDKGFEELKKDVIAYMDEVYPDKNITFKVESRRAKKTYPKKSMEINYDLGEAILYAFPEIRVDVHHPDVLLHVEVREEIYIYSEIIPGPGGMPIGTNGTAMLLLSGGIDSPVAGYMISKRGVGLEATYFHAPPYTSERAKQKVVDLAKQVSKYTGPIKLHVVNFTDIQLYIYEKCPHDELTIIMRRYMMRIAEHFAKEDGCLGLITGESIGQVLLQTTHVVLHLRGCNLGINLRRSDVFMAQHHGNRLQRYIFGQSKRRGESMSPHVRREILVDARPGCEFFQRCYHAVAVLDRKNPVFGQLTRITPVLLDKL